MYISPTIGGVKVGETKRKILEESIRLFSERSFATVTTRDITKAADIKPASLYSHFPSKEDILRQLYAFYEENIVRSWPDVDALLRDAKTDPPLDVLARASHNHDPQIREAMDRIMSIAANDFRLNSISETFINQNIIDSSRRILGALFERMLELGRIEQFDIYAFLTLYTNFAYSAALRNFTSSPVTMEDWHRGLGFLYGMIKPTGK